MAKPANDVNVVLIADIASRATMLHDIMARAGVDGVIRRLSADNSAIDCVRQSGAYQHETPPDLYLFDYSSPDSVITSVLKEIAFCSEKPEAPVILMVSPKSQLMLDAGEIDDGMSVMLSPTSLPSFVRKLRVGRRKLFFRALRTLCEFGPILVRTPETALRKQKLAMSA